MVRASITTTRFRSYVILLILLFCSYRITNQKEISEYDEAETDAVPAEGLEIVFLDVTQEQFDGDDGNDKCGRHADGEYQDFSAGVMPAEFDKFQKACPEHDGNREEKGEFCSDEAGRAK